MTIHVLKEGRALCGIPGQPKDWPPTHYWARLPDDRDRVNCPGCCRALEAKK